MELQLNVHPRITAALGRGRFKSFTDILSLSGPDLQRITRLSFADVERLKNAAAEAVPRLAPVTALCLASPVDCPPSLRRCTLTTGCSLLDAALRGGIISQTVTEVFGESGCGKTQLCLQLCITAQLSRDLGGLSGGVLYICTEDVFPNRRLVEMVDRFKKRCRPMMDSIKFTDNVYIEHIADVDSLRQCLESKCPVLLASRNVKLVVVDSIAALFRSEFSAHEYVSRAKQLNAVARFLHRHASAHNIPVVVVNQVTDDFSSSDASPHFSSLVNKPRRKLPALGLTWSNSVGVRLLLSRTSQSVTITSSDIDACDGSSDPSDARKGSAQSSVVTAVRSFDACVRTLEVRFAPHLAPVVVRLIIDRDGLKDIE